MKPKYLLFLLLLISILSTQYSTATVRYVSKTGTSVAPYTTWQTAADSIQKCINICIDGDTVYVANGVYYESLIVNRSISLIGSSIDSTVIDGTGLLPDFATIYFLDHDSYITSFKIVGSGINSFRSGIDTRFSNTIGKFIHILNAYDGISINFSSAKFSDCIINNIKRAIRIEDPADTSHPSLTNSIIITKNNGISPAIYLSFGGTPEINNNIIIEEDQGNTLLGISSDYVKGKTVSNNFVSGYQSANIKVGQIGSDTAYVINNTSVYAKPLTAVQNGSIVINSGEKTVLKNNIMAHGYRGVYCYGLSVKPEYNLYWDITQQTAGNINEGIGNIYADPMFLKDTLPNSQLDFDYHLQAYSPAIDMGDPSILDVDGSRSDIGLFGGPYGEKYTYRDLAPKPPSNLTAVMDSGLVKLRWNKNTEKDFYRYRVYRDTVPDFMYDTTKIIAVIPDTVYYDDPPQKYISGNYYYKITALDNTQHQSAPSEEVHVNITGIPEGPPIVLEHYRLLNNYPNPFNPSTIIPYRLKEGGYVKLYVYDVKGELVRVLVNGYQNAGYYEVRFNPTEAERNSNNMNMEWQTGYNDDVASGIYLYQIMVKGEGDIPVFTDMKKMILLK